MTRVASAALPMRTTSCSRPSRTGPARSTRASTWPPSGAATFPLAHVGASRTSRRHTRSRGTSPRRALRVSLARSRTLAGLRQRRRSRRAKARKTAPLQTTFKLTGAPSQSSRTPRSPRPSARTPRSRCLSARTPRSPCLSARTPRSPRPSARTPKTSTRPMAPRTPSQSPWRTSTSRRRAVPPVAAASPVGVSSVARTRLLSSFLFECWG
mmetsp:Transcript_51259/g.158696  ORF Transcript_51259/g.158696 Transcript_51259/m.158696 type:complete len:211 (-) Transcript_51259:75-707(-)